MSQDPFLNPQPIYLRPKTAPEVQKYQDALQMVATQQGGLLIGGVTPDLVKEDLMPPATQEIIIASQHYPEAMEALIFGINIGFQYTDEDPTPMPEHDWKGHPPVIRWFQKISNGLPMMLFFLADHDARFYALAGDLLTSGAIPFSSAPEKEVPFPVPAGHVAITFPPPVAQQLAQRLHNASYMMHMFCHGTGVDPEPYI